MKRIKFISIVCCVLMVIRGFSQSSADTIRIQKDLVEIALHSNYSSMNGSYTIAGRSVDKESFEFIIKKLDSISNIVFNNSCKYYVFLNHDNKVVEEGWWCVEFYSGYYKCYFPNGNVKEEGYYTESCDSVFMPGQKLGNWTYYNENGRIKKVVNYSPTEFRTHSEMDPNLPPCTCIQKMLYKNRDCITLPPSKQRGKTSYYFSDSIFNKNIGDGPALELSLLQKYSSEFMDSVFSKNECLYDGIFVIKIFKHNTNDTTLGFSMSYIKTTIEFNGILAYNYITIKDRKVFIVFSHDLKNDSLRSFLPILKKEEDFRKYLSNPKTHNAYTGEYILHGGIIEATFSPPYYTGMSSEERIVW